MNCTITVHVYYELHAITLYNTCDLFKLMYVTLATSQHYMDISHVNICALSFKACTRGQQNNLPVFDLITKNLPLILN